jgi:hypothetical protein
MLLWMLVLAGLFLGYELSSAVRDHLPSSLGQIPPGAIWFGALGALTVSLSALSSYHCEWDHCYDTWHAIRPIVGAIVGPVGCLILIVTTKVASATAVAPDPPTFYVVAFVLGFREQSFRGLIKKAADLLITPGDTGTGSKP